jgi:hypothetical protein
MLAKLSALMLARKTECEIMPSPFATLSTELTTAMPRCGAVAVYRVALTADW